MTIPIGFFPGHGGGGAGGVLDPADDPDLIAEFVDPLNNFISGPKWTARNDPNLQLARTTGTITFPSANGGTYLRLAGWNCYLSANAALVSALLGLNALSIVWIHKPDSNYSGYDSGPDVNGNAGEFDFFGSYGGSRATYRGASVLAAPYVAGERLSAWAVDNDRADYYYSPAESGGVDTSSLALSSGATLAFPRIGANSTQGNLYALWIFGRRLTAAEIESIRQYANDNAAVACQGVTLPE